MPGWSDIAVVSGGAAAALMGLLRRGLSSRATQTLTLFATAIVAAILVTVPAQPKWAFGCKKVALAAVLAGAAMIYLILPAEPAALIGVCRAHGFH